MNDNKEYHWNLDDGALTHSVEYGIDLKYSASTESFPTVEDSLPGVVFIQSDNFEAAKVESLAMSYNNLQLKTMELEEKVNKLLTFKFFNVLVIRKLRLKLDILAKDLASSKVKNDALDIRIFELELEIESVKREKIMERNLMLVRQLASAYQYRSALYVDVGCKDRRFCTTHAQLIDSANKSGVAKKMQKAKQIEAEFVKLNPNLSCSQYIANIIKRIRELGTSTSHPSMMIHPNMSESTPTATDMVDIIEAVYNDGKISLKEKQDAHIILKVINFLSTQDGILDVLRSDDI